mmetsp:Transcript_1216/g.1607  ORF Transcript_1216/g.1607 Transcript_1216/m.1607 type:complete len:99 (-) Transcript_1216:256-552(-)
MESPGYSIGSFASFDNEGGECADGDVIHVLDHDEGIPCVDQIIFWGELFWNKPTTSGAITTTGVLGERLIYACLITKTSPQTAIIQKKAHKKCDKATS